jgi:hypothetical protein
VSTTEKQSLDYRIPASSGWSGAWRILLGIGLVGAAGAAYAYFGHAVSPERFAYAYLFGLFVPLSLALGSLFFVMVLHITKSSWGVTVRRVAELFMRPIPVFAVLVIPLVFLLPTIFPWLGGGKPEGLEGDKAVAAEHAGADKDKDKDKEKAEKGEHETGEPNVLAESRGDPTKEPVAMRWAPPATGAELQANKRLEKASEHEEHEVLEHKAFYLNKRFFLVRLIGYLVIWTWLAYRFFQWSTTQDKTKALENTAAAQKFAPAGLVLFGATVSFFAFDWFLSLSPGWYSTMFGVQVFAQIALFQTACLIFATILLRRSGLLGKAVTIEHFHDLGKLLFGWIVFWSYVSFAQFFLTWYSNIPDELTFFHLRWHDNGGTWKNISLALILFHFFIPFWFTMSRNIKRRIPLLAVGALIMMVMHVIEVYWVVLPYYGPLAPSWVDLACLLGPLGLYLASVLRGMEDYALIPVGDPRLNRALTFENA